MSRTQVDITELYDLFVERKNCYFVCCDIKSLIPINEISRKAGDLAILEAMNRMNQEAGEEDYVFRIGGDEFCMLTASESEEYAEKMSRKIEQHNGKTFRYEGEEIPLAMYVTYRKYQSGNVKYNELFSELHTALREAKVPK